MPNTGKQIDAGENGRKCSNRQDYSHDRHRPRPRPEENGMPLHLDNYDLEKECPLHGDWWSKMGYTACPQCQELEQYLSGHLPPARPEEPPHV
jgi:hypothetical protein